MMSPRDIDGAGTWGKKKKYSIHEGE